MPVPSPRNSIRIARGNYSDLLTNVSEIGEGELCFALDQDKFYSKSGGSLFEVGKGTALATLGQIQDVDVAGAVNGESLQYNSTSGNWEAVALVKADITDFSDADYATAAQGALADTAAQPTGTTYTGTLGTTERMITAGAFDLATGNHWTCGAITVPAPTNATAGTSGLIRITAGPVVWNAVFKFPGGSAPVIATFPAVIPFYVESASVILMGNVAEGIA
jgi:hypothetical protein